MSLLVDAGIEFVAHYSPLHYLPFLARSRALKSKPALRAEGFDNSHFRSKSRSHDEARGFGDYAFLTLEIGPRIVKAKLCGGFPHIEVAVPAAAVDSTQFALCRYNIAMTRVLRRNGKPGRPESETNGRYYDSKQVPIAMTHADKCTLMSEHYGKNMIEVLVPNQLQLPNDVKLICYSADDLQIVQQVLIALNCPWQSELLPPPGQYNRNADYALAVSEFINRALGDPDWRGDGLEFDRV